MPREPHLYSVPLPPSDWIGDKNQLLSTIFQASGSDSDDDSPTPSSNGTNNDASGGGSADDEEFDEFDWDEEEGGDNYFETDDEEFALQEDLKQMLAELDPQYKEKAGHSLNTMLLGCTYNGKPCSPK